jgi:hypothetical protein
MARVKLLMSRSRSISAGAVLVPGQHRNRWEQQEIATDHQPNLPEKRRHRHGSPELYPPGFPSPPAEREPSCIVAVGATRHVLLLRSPIDVEQKLRAGLPW